MTVSGNTPLFNKEGRYNEPSGHIGFWFNLPPNTWQGLYFGRVAPTANQGAPVLHVGEVDLEGACSYRAVFNVPNVPAGRYAIVLVSHGRRSEAALAPLELQVK